MNTYNTNLSNLKIGQRWKYHSDCDEFVTEVLKFDDAHNVQMKILYVSVSNYDGWYPGRIVYHTLYDNCYSLLAGQDAPII
jgi:hypothetical protein